jgi:Platelet-activating factor acetylhydrolase, isoform II
MSLDPALGGARPIVTFIWYPAAADNSGNPMLPAVYPLDPLGFFGLPDLLSTDFEAYGVDPAYQEVAASADGPFPLVVFSTGAGGGSPVYVHIGARLASHGFVVAIVANYGDGGMWEPENQSGLIGVYIDRTWDIQYLMTRLVADSNEPGNLLYGAIRADQIAVAGQSLGGLATLALAGGDDLACDWPIGADPNNIPPETCVPISPDPRIKAIVPIDMTSYALHYAEMARIEIPSMIIGQEWDNLERQYPGLGLASLLARPHSAIQGHPNYRVDVDYYHHMSFSSACSYVRVMHDYGIYDDWLFELSLQFYCPYAPVPPDEYGNLLTRYMIAFLKTVLAGEPAYREMLTPGYALANEPYIEFFVTEKRSPNALDADFPEYFTYFMHQPGTEQARALKDPQGIPPMLDFPFWP